MKTMICLILDRSGSMAGREKDVIGGVNTFIDEQKKLPDPASMAFVRFDTESIERFRAMQPLEECEHLKVDDFLPRGGTPLLDAVGGTITALDADWKSEKPDRAIVIIVTDGEENSSKEFTKEKIQAMIKARQDSGLWAFIYLGANVDAFHEAGRLGVAASNTAGYTATAAGTKHMYRKLSDSVGVMRASGSTFAHNLASANLGEGDDEPPQSAVAPPVAPPTPTWSPPT
jgi:uncharacterized protein YegL